VTFAVTRRELMRRMLHPEIQNHQSNQALARTSRQFNGEVRSLDENLQAPLASALGL
jgi:hypothetical protein